ncbi:MAG TPA: DUF1559 domain-containing protein, partial [Gemmataceae bacterium]|nr:DUF1559 domain-containing protein [Gemmataceae bacterium]
LLRRRLVRRGIALTTVALASALAAPASPAALTGLIRTTIQTVKLFAAGSALSPSIAAFTEGVSQALYWTRVKLVMVVLLVAGLGGVGTAFWAVSPNAAEPVSEPTPRARAAAAPADDKAAPPGDADKLTRDMAQSRLNLRKLALAMHAYEAANKHLLPPPALINKDGKAVLSWRVLILPYLGERALYEQFKLSEPWDSPHNKKLLSKMPKVFAPPGIKARQPFSTFYQVFVSPKPTRGNGTGLPEAFVPSAAFVLGQPSRYPASFPDGLANTILIVEASRAVPWTKPEDLPYAADQPIPELGGLFREVFHAAFVDAHVETLTKKYDEFNLRLFIMPNDGLVMDFEKVKAQGAAAAERRKNRQLRQNLEDAQERLRLLQEERDVLLGRPVKKHSPDAEAHWDKLKKENARLQNELEKVVEERKSLYAEIHQRLQKSAQKKGP